MDLATFRNSFQNESIIDPWKQETTKKKLLAGIEAAKKFLKTPQKLYIGTSWVEGEGGSYTNVNPNHRDEEFGPFPIASTAQAERALEEALKLFPSWREIPFTKRVEIIRNIRKQFEREKWTLIGLLMMEVGKTALEASADWAEAIDFLNYYANSCELLHHDDFLAVTAMPGHANRLVAKPLGLGVSLAPFNFPCAIFTGMWAAPTVMGNVMVVKPSPRAPGTGIFCAKLFAACHAPFQLVLEGKNNNNAIGKLLVEHPDVAVISFTGSKQAGMEINRAAAKTSERWIKRVVAEMGGCDFIAIHDYDNLDEVVDAIEQSCTGFQGQKCSALSRVMVKEEHYDEIKQAVLKRFQSIRLQDVTQPESLLGGVIDERSKRTIEEQCKRIIGSGGKFLLGGEGDESYPGFGIPPSIHEGLNPRGEMAGEEIFGPVFGLYQAKDFDELVDIANVTPYALTGSLFTKDPNLQARITEFSSGNTYLNRKCTGSLVGTQPFGGWYGSGTDDKAGHWSHLLRFLQWQTISEKR